MRAEGEGEREKLREASMSNLGYFEWLLMIRLAQFFFECLEVAADLESENQPKDSDAASST